MNFTCRFTSGLLFVLTCYGIIKKEIDWGQLLILWALVIILFFMPDLKT